MRILILQAGFNELGTIQKFHELGHYVISIGNQKGLIGQQYVDEYHCLDYSDCEAVLKFAIEKKIDRVCACCNDTAVLTACYVAEKLGLENYEEYNTAKTICHKNLFKKYANANDVLTVPSKSFEDNNKALEYIKFAEYPIIIKPVDMSGGKGVSRCDSYEEAIKGINKAFDYSRDKVIIIERFVEGTQHGFCTFLQNKKVIACCSNDEISLVNKYRVEIDMFPATDYKKYAQILIQQAEKMAEELELKDGIFHMQYIVSNGKIYILEAMRRIIGNMYSIPASKVCGFDWDLWEAKANIGEKCNIKDVYDKSLGYYAYRAIIPKCNGVVENVIVDKQLEPYIFNSISFWKKGQKVDNYLSETLGILFFQFDSEEEMHRIMIDNSELVHIKMAKC